MAVSDRDRPIEGVVFDIGGVLLDWNPRYLYRKLFDDEQAMDRFLGEVCTLDWHADHDRGVPMDQSCSRLAERHPEHAELIRAWAERTEEMIAGPIAGSVEILRALKDRGVRCYALTNMEAETYPVRVQRYEFMRWFDGTVVSSAEGIVKPDPAIFRRLLERFGLEPSSTVMIDDSPPNLETARSLGMQAIRFRSADRLRGCLERLGLLELAPTRTAAPEAR